MMSARAPPGEGKTEIQRLCLADRGMIRRAFLFLDYINLLLSTFYLLPLRVAPSHSAEMCATM